MSGGPALSKRALLASGLAATLARPSPALAAIRPDDTIGAHLEGIDVLDGEGRAVPVAALFGANDFTPAVRDFLVAELARRGGSTS